MPLFHLHTNVSETDVDSSLLKALSAAVAETSKKPESLCQVSVRAGVPMLFGGTSEPTAFAEYICIGGIGGVVNEGITAKFSQILEDKLYVSRERFYIKFVDPAPADMGLQGTTCKVLFYS